MPFINDTAENIQGILSYCKEANVKGILTFGMGMTLRFKNREYYYKKLDEHFPNLKRESMKKYGSSSKLHFHSFILILLTIVQKTPIRSGY